MPAYLSFDIDCLDPAFAPGTGTPVAGGLSSAQALMTMAGLGQIEFVGGDVVEVSPPYDHADITAIAAATVAQHYLGLLATRRQRG
jgi:agmatinase